jgi:hypothetical protein
MAVVESVERDVVVELGVPLVKSDVTGVQEKSTHGISVGVSGLEGGGGRLIKVGVDILSDVSWNRALCS